MPYFPQTASEVLRRAGGRQGTPLGNQYVEQPSTQLGDLMGFGDRQQGVIDPYAEQGQEPQPQPQELAPSPEVSGEGQPAQQAPLDEVVDNPSITTNGNPYLRTGLQMLQDAGRPLQSQNSHGADILGKAIGNAGRVFQANRLIEYGNQVEQQKISDAKGAQRAEQQREAQIRQQGFLRQIARDKINAGYKTAHEQQKISGRFDRTAFVEEEKNKRGQAILASRTDETYQKHINNKELQSSLFGFKFDIADINNKRDMDIEKYKRGEISKEKMLDREQSFKLAEHNAGIKLEMQAIDLESEQEIAQKSEKSASVFINTTTETGQAKLVIALNNDKILSESMGAYGGARKLGLQIVQADELLNSGAITGGAGKILSVAKGLEGQLGEIARLFNLGDNEEAEGMLLGMMSGEATNETQQLETLMVQMIYSLAKTNDNGGRLSDKDIAIFKTAFGGSLLNSPEKLRSAFASMTRTARDNLIANDINVPDELNFENPIAPMQNTPADEASPPPTTQGQGGNDSLADEAIDSILPPLTTE